MNTVQMGSPRATSFSPDNSLRIPRTPAGTGAGMADALLGLDASASL